jgi:hypothetical protein
MMDYSPLPIRWGEGQGEGPRGQKSQRPDQNTCCARSVILIHCLSSLWGGMKARRPSCGGGFTLIELLVVVALFKDLSDEALSRWNRDNDPHRDELRGF